MIAVIIFGCILIALVLAAGIVKRKMEQVWDHPIVEKVVILSFGLIALLIGIEMLPWVLTSALDSTIENIKNSSFPF